MFQAKKRNNEENQISLKQKSQPFIILDFWEKVIRGRESYSLYEYFCKFYGKPKQLQNAISSFKFTYKESQFFKCCIDTMKILSVDGNIENGFFIKQIWQSENFFKITEIQLENLEQKFIKIHSPSTQNSFNKDFQYIEKFMDFMDLQFQNYLQCQQQQIIKYLKLCEKLISFLNSKSDQFSSQLQKVNELVEKFSQIKDSEPEIIEKGENQLIQEQQILEYLESKQNEYKLFTQLFQQELQESLGTQVRSEIVSEQMQQDENFNLNHQDNSQEEQTNNQKNFQQNNNKRIKKYQFQENNSYQNCPAEPSILELQQINEENYDKVYGGQIFNLQKVNDFSTEQFLNNHFFILREDFMQGFRKAITVLKKYKFQYINDAVKDNVFLYSNVEFQSLDVTNKGIVYQISLNLMETQAKMINWKKTRRLKAGSFLIITNQDFQLFLFCKIVDLPSLNDEGKVYVKLSLIETCLQLQIGYMNTLLAEGKPLFAIENKLFLEQYIYYLKQLKKMDPEELPFQKFIVKGNRDPIPNLFKKNQLNRAQQLVSKYGKSLDQSQQQAIYQIVTKQIALVQGPPGTGKTYCGALGIRILLELKNEKKNHYQRQRENDDSLDYNSDNEGLGQGSILIVCQTNHALDQFLHHILDFCPSYKVSRLGGKCKESRLEKITLMNFQRKRKIQFDWTEFYKLKQELAVMVKRHSVLYDMDVEDIFTYTPKIVLAIVKQYLDREQIELQELISEQNQKIIVNAWFNDISTERLKQNVIFTEGVYFLNFTIDDTNIDKKSFEQLVLEDQKLKQQQKGKYSKQKNVDEANDSQYTISDNEIDSQSDEDSQSIFTGDEEELQELQGMFQYSQQQKIESSEKFLTLKDQIEKIEKNEYQIWEMRTELKSILQNFISLKKQISSLSLFNSQTLQYDQELNKIKEISNSRDIKFLQEKQIIAATMAGCAKYSDLLSRLTIDTLVIEEAGEVLESHLISNLYPSINHLILIGDHQQLQPKLQCFNLEQKYQANVSLFERFIKNGQEYVSLEFQRRLKTKFADFIRLIYKNYHDHERIEKQNLQTIGCLNDDLIFFDHQQLENTDDSGQSKSNKFEADMIIQLTQYLIQNEIKNTQITILTTYKRQCQIIKNKLKQKVKVSTVDDYQGDENDIIILSLVRSNNQKRLGYVGKDNRICVALSRARLGLIVFGNFRFIQEAVEAKLLKENQNGETSGLWLKIIELAESKNAIKNSIDLTCQKHKKIFKKIQNLNNWKQIQKRGCNEACLQNLSCGHLCQKKCHMNKHYRSDCKVIIEKVLKCKHSAKVKCGQKFNKCQMKLEKQLICGHNISIRCYQKDERLLCKFPCEKNLDCGHNISFLCYQKYERLDCKLPCEKILVCGHSISILCYEWDQRLLCKLPCEKILVCGHQWKGICYQANEIQCQVEIQVKLDCSHIKNLKCHQKKSQIHLFCEEKCQKILNCGHPCTGGCAICFPELHQPCLEQHTEIFDCGHSVLRTLYDCKRCENSCDFICNCKKQCQLNCYEQCQECLNDCSLECIHSKCNKKCFEYCDREACNQECQKLLPCGCLCKGFCGEVCPLICNVQTHQTLYCDQEIRFYQLECKSQCIYEAPILDQFMLSQSKQSLVKCQKCQSIVWQSSRYQNIIKETLLFYNKKKQEIMLEEKVNIASVKSIISMMTKNKLFLELINLTDYISFVQNVHFLQEKLCQTNNFTLNFDQDQSIPNKLSLQIIRKLCYWKSQNEKYKSQAQFLLNNFTLNECFEYTFSPPFWEALKKRILNLYKYQQLEESNLRYKLKTYEYFLEKIAASNFSLDIKTLRELTFNHI